MDSKQSRLIQIIAGVIILGAMAALVVSQLRNGEQIAVTSQNREASGKIRLSGDAREGEEGVLRVNIDDEIPDDPTPAPTPPPSPTPQPTQEAPGTPAPNSGNTTGGPSSPGQANALNQDRPERTPFPDPRRMTPAGDVELNPEDPVGLPDIPDRMFALNAGRRGPGRGANRTPSAATPTPNPTRTSGPDDTATPTSNGDESPSPSPSPTEEIGQASIYLSPSSATVPAGEAVALDLYMDVQGEAAGGYTTIVLFNPLNVQVDALYDGGNVWLGQPFVAAVNNDRGSIQLSSAQGSVMDEPTGRVHLAQIYFLGMEPGTAQIQLVESEVSSTLPRRMHLLRQSGATIEVTEALQQPGPEE